MSIYISTNPGELEISPLYADNEIVLQEVCFSVWYDEWSEFEKSQLFRDIVSYVENCRREIPERHIDVARKFQVPGLFRIAFGNSSQVAPENETDVILSGASEKLEMQIRN